MTFKVFDRDGNGFICRTDDELGRATPRDDELGREAHRQRECVQNMLMHCQPQTKANCVKIETKLNSISATTTSRQETLTNRRGKNKEDPITHVEQTKSTSQSESQVQSEAPREKRVQTKKERRYRKPHSAEAARQGGFHGRPQQSDRRIQSVGTPACKRREKHSAAQLKLM